jgi:hypothetical protein
MKSPLSSILLAFFLLLPGTVAWAAEGPAPSNREQPLSMSDAPSGALATAQRELDGKPTEAKTVQFEGKTAYQFGRINEYGKHPTVIVNRDGKVLKPISPSDLDED